METSNANTRVMIVDDEPFFRGLLRDILTKGGFTIAGEAGDGVEALEKYRTLRPDAVLMDIFMPEKNGIEATQDLLALDPGANVIICSGTGYDDDVEYALSVGAKSVIYKPFMPNEVIDAIRGAVQK